MKESSLRDEICRVGESLFSRGYVHSTAGNISARTEDGAFLITPTDACLGTLDPTRISKVSADGNLLGGDAPSKTLVLHRRIYGVDSSAQSIIHTHSTHLVALSLNPQEGEDFIPPITPYFVMKVGRVPLIPYRRPGSPEVGDLVAEQIRRGAERSCPIRAVMIERLGPNVWHQSPEQARAVLEELEETARLWLMTGACPLTEEQIEELRRTFGAAW